MEGGQPGNNGGDNGGTHGRNSPERTEIDTVVPSSVSAVFTLPEIEKALRAAWDGQSNDAPLVRAVHQYLPELQQVASATGRNTSLEEENKHLKDQINGFMGNYMVGGDETGAQTAISHLDIQRKDLKEKLKSVESAWSLAEEANRAKDRQIETLSAKLDSFGKALADRASLVGGLLISPTTNDTTLAADNKTTILGGAEPTSEEAKTSDKPGTRNEEADGKKVGLTQTSTAPNSKKRQSSGSKAARRAIETLADSAKDVSVKLAELEKQKTDLQQQIKETDDRDHRVKLGKRIGVLGKDIKALQRQEEETKHQIVKVEQSERQRIIDLERDLDRIRGEEEIRVQRIAVLTRNIESLERRIADLIENNDDLSKDNAELLMQIEEAAVFSKDTRSEDDTVQRLEECEERRFALERANEELAGKTKEGEERYTALEISNQQIIQDLEAAVNKYNQMIGGSNKSLEALEAENDKLNNQLTEKDNVLHQKMMASDVEQQRKDEMERNLQDCERNCMALEEENMRLVDENTDFKKRAEAPPAVSVIAKTEDNDLNNAAKDNTKSPNNNAEEVARCEAENEDHELQIARLEAELRQARETIAKYEADREHEHVAMYTKHQLNEVAIAHSKTLKTNADDMAECIAENKSLLRKTQELENELHHAQKSKTSAEGRAEFAEERSAFKKRIFDLEALLYNAQQRASSSGETTASPNDSAASNGEIIEAQGQQKEAEAKNDSANATSYDVKSSEVQALLLANADLKAKLDDCEAHGRTLQKQVDEMKKQLRPSKTILSKEETRDLEIRIADLEVQLQLSHEAAATYLSTMSENFAEAQEKMEELAGARAMIEELLGELRTIEDENLNLKARVVKLEGQATISSSGATMDALSSDLVDCNANVVEMKRQAEDLKADLAELIAENSDLEAKLTDCEGQAEELKSKVKKREEELDEFSHDNTDLVRRLAYSESGVRTTTKQRAFELAVEVEVARRSTATSTLFSGLSSRIQGVKKAYAAVVKSVEDGENNNTNVLESIKEYQSKIGDLEVYLESGPQYSNGRAPNLENTGADQPANLVAMTADLKAASETIIRLHRQVSGLREQNRRLKQDKIDAEKERNTSSGANNEETATSTTPLDEASERPGGGQRSPIQSQHDQLEECQNERADLRYEVNALKELRSERMRDNRRWYSKSLQYLKRLQALESQLDTLSGASDDEKNKEIKRLQAHNTELYGTIDSRETTIGKVREELDQTQNIMNASNVLIQKLRRQLEELRTQNVLGAEEIDTFRSQTQKCMQQLEQMEYARITAEAECRNKKHALSEQIREKDGEISRLGRNKEERDQLRTELRDTTTALAQCQAEKLLLQSATLASPQGVPTDPSDDLARCHAERDRLRTDLATTRTDLARTTTRLQGLLANPTAPDPPSPPTDDDLARCRAQNRHLREQLERAEARVRALERAFTSDTTAASASAPSPHPALQSLEGQLALADREIPRLAAALRVAQALLAPTRAAHDQLQADLQAARADFAESQNLNTYLQDRLGQLLRELFRVLDAHLGVAPPAIEPPWRLDDVQPWLRDVVGRLEEARRLPRPVVPRWAGVGAFWGFGSGRGSSCAACGALEAVVGDLDQTLLVRRADFEDMRATLDEIVWGLEERVEELEGRVKGGG
ncbi:hypothetical protein MMC34_003805 [Xylographa carneopallida]|nr:hypothetical protein [Xylographa carneopallida]